MLKIANGFRIFFLSEQLHPCQLRLFRMKLRGKDIVALESGHKFIAMDARR